MEFNSGFKGLRTTDQRIKTWFKVLFFLWRCGLTGSMDSSVLRFLRSHTTTHQRRGRTPLGEWSARRRDLYLTTHNTRNSQTSMHSAGFELKISVGERPQTHTLETARLLGSASLICRQRKKFIYYRTGRVVTGFKNSAVSRRPEFCSLSVDRRLTWRKHITTKRKQLDLKPRNLYWIIGRKSQLSLENKLLVYKVILKPVWTYGIQLWGNASNSNLGILERFPVKSVTHNNRCSMVYA
jgi:hypothetical protein